MDPVTEFKNEKKRLIAQMGHDDLYKKLGVDFMIDTNDYKYCYNFSWLGRPIIQYPQDIVAVQELIWDVKPDLIIETGIAHGGSLILSASMLSLIEYCDAINKGTIIDPKKPNRYVVGIDIDIRAHNRKLIEEHPLSNRIHMIQGSSTATDVISQVRDFAKKFKKIMVFLDSMHTHDHVLGELNAYAGLVSVGSYCVVFDTVIEDIPEEMHPNRPWSKGNNPKTAVCEFLKSHKEYEIDKEIENKLVITVNNDGFLRKIR